MPQMSPMWWTTLFIMFNLILIMINSIMYFNIKMSTKTLKKFKTVKLNWKW